MKRSEDSASVPAEFWTPARIRLAVALLLVLHYVLAASSLLRENPTVDEVAHLPAGITYWQTGTFKLYHHNPPLFKLVAALPVLLARPNMMLLYGSNSWNGPFPDHATCAQIFAIENFGRYFELFARARLVMPLFGVLGGLVVFAWSRALYGPLGGLLSLTLWALCPNVLAHGRLVTSDVSATVIGVGATYLFWRYLHQPTWRRATAAGFALGLAELAKFSMLLLYGLWPLLWLAHELFRGSRRGLVRRLLLSLAQGAWIIALSVLVIDLGYGFEGVGLPLGSRRYEFASKRLTRPRTPAEAARAPHSPNELFELAWRERVNRFRGTILAEMPAPLPKHYLLGYDEQMLEAEGVPLRWFPKPPLLAGPVPRVQGKEAVTGYPVYLDGEMRTTGWRSYYLRAALYKVPEGTWALVVGSFVVLIGWRRARAPWGDELTLLIVPAAFLTAMIALTDINLGLRYALPVFPYFFIAAGKLVPWASGFSRPRARLAASAGVGACLVATAVATFAIHPHHLAYFNWASGGPGRGSEHLIDSNLDWGQDLVGLKEWLANHASPGERVGLAYFGQVNPSLFLRRDPLNWFLPPGAPGPPERPRSLTPRVDPAGLANSPAELIGPARRLEPGLYAISATLLRGLPWRLFDPNPYAPVEAWKANEYAFSYFQELTPIAKVGYSIFVYRLSPEDAERLNRRLGL